MNPGTRLGPYEILSEIGAGGMGAVYKARDTRLDRIVAIKVSHEQFTERFEREARTVAALNHPNICSLYDVGTNFLVMEYVEGETLAGPVPLETAIGYARQIAEAIEAAHDRGIIHRDLKPANIKITADGSVKVLDFGLAKALDEVPAQNPQNSPTLTLGATRVGVILGTAPYMSPEQAKGRPADRRSDIWAYGVVLYEMLTGKQLFQGETTSDILAAVIRDEPNLKSLPSTLHPLVTRCLAKDPKRRLQAIGEARLMLEDPEFVRQQSPRTGMSVGPWIVAGVSLISAMVFAGLYFRQTLPERRTLRFQISGPGRNTSQYRLSPNGRYLAFSAVEGGRTQLFVHSMDSLQSRVLPGTDDVRFPFWSPDSAWIGFFSGGRLKKVSVNGGPAQPLCDAPQGVGGTWNRDGIIVFQPGPGNGTSLMRVSQAGGEPVPVTKVQDNSEGHVFPEFLPDGNRFLFYKRGESSAGIYVGSLDGSQPLRVLPDDSNAVFVPSLASNVSGYLLFRRENTLMAQPFDPRTLKQTGEVFPIAEQVGIGGPQSFGAFSASADGTLVLGGGGAGLASELVWVDRTGKTIRTAGPTGVYANIRLSPNEQDVVFARFQANNSGDIWTREIARNVDKQITFDPSAEAYPTWSPDGLRILFLSNISGTFDVYSKAASGAGSGELVVKAGTPQGAIGSMDWSPTGRFILYPVTGGRTGQDLWILPLEGDKKPFPYLQELYNESEGVFSPDGKFVAYVSNESGQLEVFVQTFPVSGGKWKVSIDGGGFDPEWSADGTELFYIRTNERSLMAVPIKLGNGLTLSTPKALFPIATGQGRRNYGVADHGQRFIVTRPMGGDSTPPATIVLNWESEVVQKSH